MTIKTWSASAAAALVLATGSAHASVATPPAAAKAAETDAGPQAVTNKKYCVIDTYTGSRIPMKRCLTRQEWLTRGFDPLDPKR